MKQPRGKISQGKSTHLRWFHWWHARGVQPRIPVHCIKNASLEKTKTERQPFTQILRTSLNSAKFVCLWIKVRLILATGHIKRPISIYLNNCNCENRGSSVLCHFRGKCFAQYKILFLLQPGRPLVYTGVFCHSPHQFSSQIVLCKVNIFGLMSLRYIQHLDTKKDITYEIKQTWPTEWLSKMPFQHR